MPMRQPIVSILGHVDHGKTTLLDYIRGSLVAKGEAGLITQHIGASEVPMDHIRRICGPLMEKMKAGILIPGLLFIDTPGHEAFTTLRKRGGAVADLGVLIIDINEGMMPQTVESLLFLKEFKTPFVVALTKIDRIAGWTPEKGASFMQAFSRQPQRVKDDFEKKFYTVVGQLSSHGFEADRYDRIGDFTKRLAVIPVSSLTGEGIPDLLMMLTGLAQKYLKDSLGVTPGEGKGTVLEVKDYKGLGTTIDVILYDGEICTGDWLVTGIGEMVVTRVRALLKPTPMKEIRVEKAFVPVKSVTAACGIKIAAPELQKVAAGSPLRAVRDEGMVARVRKEIEQEVSEVEIDTHGDGVLIKADTLGSLEALVKTLREAGVPIRKAGIGTVIRQDINEMRNIPKPIIFAFNVKMGQEIEAAAKDNGIRIFSSDIIYRLLEDYDRWVKDSKKRAEEDMLSTVCRPGRVRIIPGYVFRQSKPAIAGVEVLKGIIRAGNRLVKDGETVGEIKEIQSQGENVGEAKAGDKVALSIDGAVIGKNVSEGDELTVRLSQSDRETLSKLRHRLRGDELELLDEAEQRKR